MPAASLIIAASVAAAGLLVTLVSNAMGNRKATSTPPSNTPPPAVPPTATPKPAV
ncbi:hypothetical protein [Acetobacter aceti]|nr:hypothetical protein [Acetobacter aceti]